MKKFATARTLAVCLLIGAASMLYAQIPPADTLDRIFFLLKNLEARLKQLESQINQPGGDAVVRLKQLQVTLPPPQLPLPPAMDAGPVIQTFAQGPPVMIPLPKADVPIRVHFICLSDAIVELDSVPIKLDRSGSGGGSGGYESTVFLSTATNTVYGQVYGTSPGDYGKQIDPSTFLSVVIRTQIQVVGEQLAARMRFDMGILKPNPLPTVTAIRPISCTLSFWS